MSKRLIASAVVGAMLLISAVLVVSLIGGDDKPDINTEIPPEEDQLPEENADDDTDDDSSTDDTDESDADTSDADDGTDDDSADDDVPDGDDDEGSDDSNDKGNGQKNGKCHRHMEANAGSSTQNNEKNYVEHMSSSDAAEDADPAGCDEPKGEPQGECNGDGEGNGRSG